MKELMEVRECNRGKRNRSMPVKWLAVGAVLLASSLSLVACGGSYAGTTSDGSKNAAPGDGYYNERAMEEYDPSFALDSESYDEGAQAPVVEEGQATTSGRKLIRTVDLTVETQEFDEMMKTLDERVKTMEGYVENMSSYNGGGYWNGSTYITDSRHASLTIRVPQSRLEAFLADLNQMGHVTNRTENTEDVTLTYVDIESHKIALETEQTRLLALLERAESVDDIISIESRLSQVRYEIGSMESQLRTYDNKVDYSTVYLDVSEVKVLTPVEEPTTWERISNGFTDSVEGVWHGLRELAIWLIVSLPYLLIWAIVICVIVLITRHFIRKAARKRAERVAEANPYYRTNSNPDAMNQMPTDAASANYQSQNGDNHGTNE